MVIHLVLIANLHAPSLRLESLDPHFPKGANGRMSDHTYHVPSCTRRLHTVSCSSLNLYRRTYEP